MTIKPLLEQGSSLIFRFPATKSLNLPLGKLNKRRKVKTLVPFHLHGSNVRLSSPSSNQKLLGYSVQCAVFFYELTR